jgi:uncharacterized phiE125 gp8 family phage protein
VYTRVITAPLAYPVTLAEAKEWCRVDSDDTSQDVVLNMLIAAATAKAEAITGRAFVERTLESVMSSFKSNEIHLPFAPLIGVDSITYTDLSLVVQTIDPSTWETNTIEEPGEVRPVWGSIWPVTGYVFNAVRVRYRAGYVAPGSPQDLTDNSYLPADLRVWMHARLATLFNTREQLIEGRSIQEIPRDFADGILDNLILGTRYF